MGTVDEFFGMERLDLAVELLRLLIVAGHLCWLDVQVELPLWVERTGKCKMTVYRSRDIETMMHPYICQRG